MVGTLVGNDKFMVPNGHGNLPLALVYLCYAFIYHSVFLNFYGSPKIILGHVFHLSFYTRNLKILLTSIKML